MNRYELLQNAKPIIFNDKMNRAVLNGSKTVTRRFIKNYKYADDVPIQTLIDDNGRFKVKDYNYSSLWTFVEDYIKAFSKYQIGDILHVRVESNNLTEKELGRVNTFLKVTDVMVERLEDITEEQVAKEGFETKIHFLDEIEKIYGIREGYCFVCEFEKLGVD